MNGHSKRLIRSVLRSIRMYEIGSMRERGLEQDLEGICRAIEDLGIQEELIRLSTKIDESIHLYDAEEGRRFLLREIREFKERLYRSNRVLLMDHDEFEKNVMELLLAGEDDIFVKMREQYRVATIASREFTGVGFFTRFSIPQSGDLCLDTNEFYFGDVDGRINGQEGAVGFVLFVRDGYIFALEGYTSAVDQWPDSYEQIDLYYDSGDKRDFARLMDKWK